MKVLAYSVTPSPYQREFFTALSDIDGVTLQVAYFEEAPVEAAWELGRLAPWESVIPGHRMGAGRFRCHWNNPLPSFAGFDRVILNAPVTGLTTQRLFRALGSNGSPPWAFWAERLRPHRAWKGAVQRYLVAPLANADAIVAIGRTAVDDYRHRFPTVPVHDIPYSCSLAEFETAAMAREASMTCRFLFAGQMIARKGVDVMLQAFARLVQSGLDVELHLVGREADLPGWMSQLDQQTCARITYLGFKQPHELPAIFAASDVFLLPSRYDGWGVVVNQALGAGMPVISSTAAGAGRDLIQDGRNGLHVLPGCADSLEAAMRRIAENPAERSAMACAALESSKVIRPESAARRWLDVLERLQ